MKSKRSENESVLGMRILGLEVHVRFIVKCEVGGR